VTAASILSADAWDTFRSQMPVARRWAYLDHAAVSPLPGPTAESLAGWAQQASVDGSVHWLSWARQVEELRSLAAAMIGAAAEEIALVSNTTHGVNLVAEGYPWQAGDNVVIPADEFPTNQYPWLNLARRGVETRRVPTENGRLDLDRLAAACDARTRVVSVSWVSYSSGWRNDVAQVADLAHQCGALLFLDAIQGLGVFPLDVRVAGVDFLAADGHKWMLGPEGAGIFYCRREHLARLSPVGVGWSSVVGASDFNRIELLLKDTAARYEGGSQNMVGLLALKTSLDLLTRLTFPAISQRVVEITDLACRRLPEVGAVIRTPRDRGHESGIVSFEIPGRDPVALRRHCLERGVVVSCRAGRLRLSAHAYNNAGDIERLAESLAEGVRASGV
jgi:selenocysteine lyase/cysteine desulfurase